MCCPFGLLDFNWNLKEGISHRHTTECPYFFSLNGWFNAILEDFYCDKLATNIFFGSKNGVDDLFSNSERHYLNPMNSMFFI